MTTIHTSVSEAKKAILSGSSKEFVFVPHESGIIREAGQAIFGFTILTKPECRKNSKKITFVIPHVLTKVFLADPGVLYPFFDAEFPIGALEMNCSLRYNFKGSVEILHVIYDKSGTDEMLNNIYRINTEDKIITIQNGCSTIIQKL